MLNNDDKNALDQTKDMVGAKPDSFTALKEETQAALAAKPNGTEMRMVVHNQLCNDLHAMYCERNAAYGDSFPELFETFGPTSALSLIMDKWHRVKTLMHDSTESYSDSASKIRATREALLDMADYCLMTIIQIDAKNDTKKIEQATQGKLDEIHADGSTSGTTPSDDGFRPMLKNRNPQRM